MSRRPIRPKDAQHPDRILSNLIKDYIEGRLGAGQVLFRVSVCEVDHIGGNLEEDPAPNPPNSIRARIITNSLDKFTADEDLQVFWPLNPHHASPIKEGEHAYVIFEDMERSHGIWIARIPEPTDSHSVNLTPGVKKYQDDPDNDFSEISAEQIVQDTDEPPSPIEVSEEFVKEDVPRFIPRVGDHVIEGSNNTAIILGRDRPGDLEKGEKEKAGTIDIIAGRADKDDMDMEKDKSRVYVSMNTDIDGNMSIDVGEASGPSAAIGVKSDEIRIVARKGMKFVVEGGDVHIEGANIFLGKDATEAVMQGDLFNTLWKEVMNLLLGHTHPSPVPNAPSPTLANLATKDLATAVTGPVLSETVKVKP